MNRRPRSRFAHTRRRQALTTWSFLRPTAQSDDDEARFRKRLRDTPTLRREYRSSLGLQLLVIGILVLSCAYLLFQSIVLLRRLEAVPRLAGLAWLIPTLVAGLGLVSLRRFLRVLAEFRKLGRG